MEKRKYTQLKAVEGLILSMRQLTLQPKTKIIAYHTQSTNPCATKGILSDRF